MLYETILAAPHDRYQQHLYVVSMGEQRRDIRWTPVAPNSIKLRCPIPLPVGRWTEVDTPPYGTRVRYDVEVPLRYCWPDRRRRPGDYYSDLDWLERHLPEWGLLADGGTIDCEQISMLIAKTRPFRQQVTRFRGIATVVNQCLLTEALTNGVSSNGRAFGLCFLVVEPQPIDQSLLSTTVSRHAVSV